MLHAQHPRDREAVNIRVHHADVQPLSSHCSRQISRHGGLTHPALAGGHRVDAREIARLSERNHRLGGPAPEATAQLRPVFIVHSAQLHLDRRNTVQGTDLALDVGANGVLQGTASHRQQHVDCDGAVLRHLHGFDHVQVGDRAADLWVDYTGQSLVHGFLRGDRHDVILGRGESTPCTASAARPLGCGSGPRISRPGAVRPEVCCRFAVFRLLQLLDVFVQLRAGTPFLHQNLLQHVPQL
ncbi:Uncharacterised protein [Actinomyces bovis]|uniref:Uncharacterized protein n=1 Tax=Actinomyces bovis TaxID=1658 RepID=A0ABY1VLV3_9ACTO|nr:Uncharacterised protein [Actinomyces bovis]